MHTSRNDHEPSGLATSIQYSAAHRPKTSHENNSTRLLDIPPELLEEIARHLPPSALPPFRLVCKHVDQIVFPIFARAFFTERTFFPSDRSSMETLRCISQHKDLVQYVCRIRFSPLIFWRDGVHNYFPSWRLEEDSTEYLDLDWPDYLVANPLASAQAQVEYDECAFIRDHLSGVLLSIFTNLHQWNHRPSVLIQPDKSSSAAEPAADQMVRGLRKWRRIARPDDIYPSFNCLYHIPIYRAILDSGFATHELDIGSWDNEFPLAQFSYRPQQFRAEHLRVLRIHLWASEYMYSAPVQQCPNRRRHIEDFTSIIAKARNLRHLNLSQRIDGFLRRAVLHSEYDAHRDVFHALATKCHVDGTPLELLCDGPVVPRLEELVLDSHVIKPELVVDFCRERRETLTKVHLKTILEFGTPSPNIIRDLIALAIRGEKDCAVSVTVEDDCYNL